MHTKEPWRASRTSVIAGEGDDMRIVAEPFRNGREGPVLDWATMEHNAARIAACVNACEGLDTVSLGAVAELGGLAARLPVISGLMRQNAELLAALEACKCHLANSLHLVRVHAPEHHWLTQIATGLDEAKAAIVKAQGGAS